MRTLLAAAATLSLALLIGCANFATNTFRAEQTSESLVYAAYVGYTNYLVQYPGAVSPESQAKIKDARLKYAATLGTLDALVTAYETNSAVQPQIEALLTTLNDQSSNIVWLVNYFRSGGH